MKRSRLGILSTHPVQYQAPWFRALSVCPELDIQVFFCHHATAAEQSNAGFGVAFDWDVPLLEGYTYRFLRNRAAEPRIGDFWGLDTPEIENIISGERFDAFIVHGWYYKAAWQAIRACWGTNTPVLARGDSHLHSPRHPVKKLLKAIPYYRFIRRFDACLAAGKWSEDYFLHYGAKRERIFVVPHCVDVRFFNESDKPSSRRSELRRYWNLGEDDIVYLFVGKFIKKKRPFDFVRAIEIANGSARRVKGLMVGDGPLRSDCERLAKESGNAIRFAGFLNQSQISRAYIACDALVLPSGGETWGLVVNEAMACGRACIVSNRVGCGPDLVRPGETGFVFVFGDVDALAKLMLDWSSRAELERMGHRARAHVARYSIPTAVEGVLQAVSTVAEKRRGACA